MRLAPFLLAAAIATPLAARATPNFPAAIARDLGLPAPPACTICHATNDGGAGTAVKPFATYLVSRGLVPFSEGSLAGALAAAAGEHHDTDRDGVSDVDALAQGLDPNRNPSQAKTLEDPTFGCSSTGGDPAGTLLLAGVVLLRLLASHLCRMRGAAVPRPGSGEGTETRTRP